MGKKIYVGNLAFDTTTEDLERLFSELGTVDTASVVSDRVTGRSRGFGFVEMSTEEEASRAIEALNGAAPAGRRLNVNDASGVPGGLLSRKNTA